MTTYLVACFTLGIATGAVVRFATGPFCHCGHTDSLHRYGGTTGAYCRGVHVIGRERRGCTCRRWSRDHRRGATVLGATTTVGVVVWAVLILVGVEIWRLM